MSVGSIGSATALPVGIAATAGRVPDLQTQRAQASAQADLLRAVRGAELPTKAVLANLSDNQGIDFYA